MHVILVVPRQVAFEALFGGICDQWFCWIASRPGLEALASRRGILLLVNSAAKGVMKPATAADNRPSPALLLIRVHRPPFRIRSTILAHILTLLMVNLLSSLRLSLTSRRKTRLVPATGC